MLMDDLETPKLHAWRGLGGMAVARAVLGRSAYSCKG